MSDERTPYPLAQGGSQDYMDNLTTISCLVAGSHIIHEDTSGSGDIYLVTDAGLYLSIKSVHMPLEYIGIYEGSISPTICAIVPGGKTIASADDEELVTLLEFLTATPVGEEVCGAICVDVNTLQSSDSVTLSIQALPMN